MQWIHTNAASLHADVSKLMIFGESAGAGSVSNHLVHPQSWPFYTRAAMESGPFADWVAQNLSTAELRFNALAHNAGCSGPANGSKSDVVECLRGVNATALLAAEHGLPSGGNLCDWTPVIDGIELTAHPAVLAAAGKFNKGVPVLLGTNADEGTEFVGHLNKKANASDVKAWAMNEFRGLSEATVDQILAQYPCSAYEKEANKKSSDCWWAATHLLGDAEMSCAARRSARWISGLQNSLDGENASAKLGASATPGVFLYFLKYKLSAIDAIEIKGDPMGVCHGSDLPLVFGFDTLLLLKDERKLSDTFIKYWTSFAADGVPSAPSAPAWPPYSKDTDQNIVFDIPMATGSKLKSELCDFWDGIGPVSVAHGAIGGLQQQI
jgi:carboxylesterase type B